MKIFILSMLLMVSASAFSQDLITITKDTTEGKRDGLVLSNGKVIWEGDHIKCGRGSLPNGDFKYITVSNMAFAASGQAIGRQYSGLLLTVKKVQKLGSKKLGYKYYLKVGGGNIVNYQCEIEDALAVGEIVL